MTSGWDPQHTGYGPPVDAGVGAPGGYRDPAAGYGAPVGAPRNPALVEYGVAPTGVAPSCPGAQYGPYGAVLPRARLRGLAGVLRVLLTLDAVAALLVLGATVWRHDTLADLAAGTAVSLEHAQDVDAAVGITGAISGIAFLVTGVVFLVWFYRVRANADYLGSYRQRRGKAWAIFGWVVPVVWLWFPFQIATDAMSEAQQAARRSGRSLPAAGSLFLGWWLAWLFSVILRVHVFWATDDGRNVTVGSVINQDYAQLGAAAMTVLAAILAVSVVNRITAAQAQVMGGA